MKLNCYNKQTQTTIPCNENIPNNGTELRMIIQLRIRGSKNLTSVSTSAMEFIEYR